MQRIIFTKLLFLVTITFAGVTAAAGQDDAKPTEPMETTVNKPSDARRNLLANLGLELEQVQKIRRLNAERKPLIQAAQRYFREANRLLDEAIYADQVDDAVVQLRLQEVQSAQTELSKIRYTNELAIRKILTPDQLVRFRELRLQFVKARENVGPQRRPNILRQKSGDNPARNLGLPARRFFNKKQQRSVQ